MVKRKRRLSDLNGYCGFPQPCPRYKQNSPRQSEDILLLFGGLLMSVEISVSQTMQNVLFMS